MAYHRLLGFAMVVYPKTSLVSEKYYRVGGKAGSTVLPSKQNALNLSLPHGRSTCFAASASSRHSYRCGSDLSAAIWSMHTDRWLALALSYYSVMLPSYYIDVRTEPGTYSTSSRKEGPNWRTTSTAHHMERRATAHSHYWLAASPLGRPGADRSASTLLYHQGSRIHVPRS